MEFRITAGEEQVLQEIVRHLDAGNAPTVPELSDGLGRDAEGDVEALRKKQWVLAREVDGRLTVIGLSPMATLAVRNLRFGRRGPSEA
ncbi:hypothetical protein [Streptomyces luteireticuli]|uniref:hypothetical protein n=1 Tax=Streptomyces luteireticuli TaxID=173858 RepID=UPI0031D6757C